MSGYRIRQRTCLWRPHALQKFAKFPLAVVVASAALDDRWSTRRSRCPYHRAPTSKSRRRRRPAQIRRGWSVSVLDGQPATPADDDANCCPIVINFPATNCCRPRPAQHRDQSSLRNRATLYIPFNSTNEIVFSRVSVCLSVCLLTGLLKNC